jgi:hypothetical protein
MQGLSQETAGVSRPAILRHVLPGTAQGLPGTAFGKQGFLAALPKTSFSKTPYSRSRLLRVFRKHPPPLSSRPLLERGVFPFELLKPLLPETRKPVSRRTFKILTTARGWRTSIHASAYYRAPLHCYGNGGQGFLLSELWLAFKRHINTCNGPRLCLLVPTGSAQALCVMQGLSQSSGTALLWCHS